MTGNLGVLEKSSLGFLDAFEDAQGMLIKLLTVRSGAEFAGGSVKKSPATLSSRARRRLLPPAAVIPSRSEAARMDPSSKTATNKRNSSMESSTYYQPTGPKDSTTLTYLSNFIDDNFVAYSSSELNL